METVHELLESRRRDGAPALIDAASGETLVGTALAARVAGRARALVAAGVRPGDRVALLVPNSLACAETLLAAATAGAAAVPINLRWTATEVDHLLADAEPRVLVATDERVRALGPLAHCPLLLSPDAVLASGPLPPPPPPPGAPPPHPRARARGAPPPAARAGGGAPPLLAPGRGAGPRRSPPRLRAALRRAGDRGLRLDRVYLPRHFQPDRRAAAAGLVRRAARGAAHRRRGGSRPALRRGRRDRAPRSARHARLLPGAGSDGGGDARRLAAHGRPRPPRCGRLPPHRRTRERAHHPRRRERLPARDRGDAARAPRGGGGCRGRRARPALRRGRVGLPRPAPGRAPGRGRGPRLVRDPPRGF